jgi:hypothetical protein
MKVNMVVLARQYLLYYIVISLVVWQTWLDVGGIDGQRQSYSNRNIH